MGLNIINSKRAVISILIFCALGIFVIAPAFAGAAYITAGNSQWGGNGSSIFYNSGSVGIGTSIPTQKLHVFNGNIFADTVNFGATNQGNIVAQSIVSLSQWRDVAQGATVTTTGGNLISGGPTAKNGKGHWDATVTGQSITLYMPGSWWTRGISFTSATIYESASPNNKLPASFLVEKSTDGTNWVTVADVTNNTNWYFYSNNLSDAPYIKITVRAFQGSQTASSIANIQVFDANSFGSDGPFTFNGNGNAVYMGGNVGVGSTTPIIKFSVNGGTGDVINVAGGSINGLNLTPINSDQAVPLGYLQNNYAPIGSGIGSAFVQGGNTFGAIANLGTNDNFNLNFETNNLPRLTLDTAGNVGIGTTAPVSKFAVADSAGATLSITTNRNNGSSASPKYSTLDFIGYLDKNSARIRASEESGNTWGSNLSFLVNDGTASTSLIERMTIFRNGNVGIGTTNPISTLNLQNVGSEAPGAGALSFTVSNDTGPGWNMRVGAAASDGDFSIDRRWGSSVWYNVLAMDRSTGNVGIGTTNPTIKLSVNNGTSDVINVAGGSIGGLNSTPVNIDQAVPLGYLQNNYAPVSIGKATGSAFIQGGNTFGTTASLGTTDNYNLNFETNNAVRMTLDKLGSLGIGVTNPGADIEIRGQRAATKDKLLLLSKFDYGSTSFYQNYSNNFYTTGKSLEIEVEALPLLQLAVNNSGSVGEVIFPNGNIGIGSTSPTIKLSVNGGTSNVLNVAGGFVNGLNSTPVNLDQAVPLGYLQANYNNFWGGLLTGNIYSLNTANTGIGTSNPLAKLELVGASQVAADRSTHFELSSGTGVLTDEKLVFGIHDGDYSWLQAVKAGTAYRNLALNPQGGNVSIGIATSTLKLNVNGGTGNALNMLGGFVSGLNSTPVNIDQAVPLGYLQNNYAPVSIGKATGSAFIQGGNLFGAIANLGTNDNYNLNFKINNTPRMTLDTSGDLGIGTTAPLERLETAGNIKYNGQAYSSKITVDPSSGIGWYRIASGNNSGGTVYVAASMDNTTQRLEFNYNMRSYVGTGMDLGTINILRTLSYNSGPISKIRLTGNSVAGDYNVYLDVYVDTATAPVSFNLYGTNGVNFLSSAVYNPASSTYAQVVDLNDIGYSGMATSRNFEVAGNSYLLGNVGIGTTTPGTRLDVYGLSNTPKSGASGLLTIRSSDAQSVDKGGSIALGGWRDDGASDYRTFAGIVGYKENSITNDTSGYLAFYTNPFGNLSEKMRITSTGKVGIGTTNPTIKLSVTGVTGDIVNVGGGSIAGLNSTPINSDQAVPLGYLQSNYAPISIGLATGTAFIQGGNTYGAIANLGTKDNYNLNFNTNNATRMTLDKLGNLGIGTTNPGAKLEIAGDILVNGQTIGRGNGNRFENTAFGMLALANNTGNFNMALGSQAMQGHTTGDNNIIMGPLAMQSDAGAYNNIAIGANALNSVTVAHDNIAFGFGVMSGADTDQYNVVIGNNIGVFGVGNNNVLMGHEAFINGFGNSNVMLGFRAGYGNSASNNIFLGNQAGYYESGGNTLLIDNLDRTSLALGRTNALIYGVSNITPSSQTLSLGGGGNVSIGTTTATVKLNVNGGPGNALNMLGGFVSGLNSTPVNIDQAVPLGYLQSNYAPVSIGKATGSAFIQGGNTFGAIANLGTSDNYNLNFETNNATRMTLDKLGNLGIGLTAPNEKLHIKEISKSEYYGTDSAFPVSNLVLEGSSSTRAIGEGPSLTFAFPANTDGTNVWSQARILATPDNNSNGSAVGRLYLQVRDSYNPGFGGSWNWRTGMMIAGNGNVGIGTTIPTSGRLQVSTATNVNAMTLGSNTGVAFSVKKADEGYGLHVGVAGSGTSWIQSGSTASATAYDLSLQASGGNVLFPGSGIWNSSGNVGIGTTNPSQSKIQLARDISPIDFSGSGIAQLQLQGATNGAEQLLLGFETTNNYAFIQPLHYGINWTDYNLALAPKGGNVGVGTTTPIWKLSIASSTIDAINVAGGFVAGLNSTPVNSDQAVPLGYLQANYAPSSGSLWSGTKNGDIWNGGAGLGNVGIGTTNPLGNRLYVTGTSYFNGGVTVNGNLALTGTRNITNVNKITADVVDPLYNIKGTNYSTYAAAIAGGLKEEYVGRISSDSFTKKDGYYESVIDLSKEKTGSDLWVWYNVIEFNDANVEIFLTPRNSFASAYSLISGTQIKIRSDRPADISMRLVGSRFDWRKWPTQPVDQSEKANLIIK